MNLSQGTFVVGFFSACWNKNIFRLKLIKTYVPIKNTGMVVTDWKEI